MSMMKPEIDLMPEGDIVAFNREVRRHPERTLRGLLETAPALSREPLSADLLDQRVGDMVIRLVRFDPGHASNALTGSGQGRAEAGSQAGDASEPAGSGASRRRDGGARRGLPKGISDEEAVRLAHAVEIKWAASLLEAGLSVLVVCDKLLVKYAATGICARAGLQEQVLTVPDFDQGAPSPMGLTQRRLAMLRDLVQRLNTGDVLVIPHLDLLAGAQGKNLTIECRELIELMYEAGDRLVLAFADRSLDLPEVLAGRFDVQILIRGVPRRVAKRKDEPELLGNVLVSEQERVCFADFDAGRLYKNVSGMNPVRLRHAIRYVIKKYAGDGPIPPENLYRAIQEFKVERSGDFEVPDVGFEHIGGYAAVKAELIEATRLLMHDAPDIPEELQGELIPRGFLFHGPPGTGKTLFAKAIARQINATIQIVSGPEVTDKYVGESERKIRELFAEARRNAPSVLVFDEFDSIAAKRSGQEDGGARAGNAMVAQMLTEMDGFRPDVPMLVIGTTNRPELIDKALKRPSRFRPISIALPDTEARRSIAEIHAVRFGFDALPDEVLDIIARATADFNGDEIRSLFREACKERYRRVQQDPRCEHKEVPGFESYEELAHHFGKLVGTVHREREEQDVEGRSQS